MEPDVNPNLAFLDEDVPEPLKATDIRDAEKKGIKDLLLDLNRRAGRECEEGKDVEGKLAAIAGKLDSADKAYPGDPDVAALKTMYHDLLKDYEEGRLLVLDEGFDEILEQMKAASAKMGLRTEIPEYSVVADTVEKLKMIGIEAAYVVTAGDPKAKTVVYFLQRHTAAEQTQEFLDATGTTDSQNLIYDGLVNGVNSGLFKDVYAESGTGDNLDLNDGAIFPFSANGDARAQTVVGGKASFHGIEEKALYGLLLDKVLSGKNSLILGMKFLEDPSVDKYAHDQKYKKYVEYRANAVNFLLAWNIASDFLSRDGSVAAITLGAGHEKYQNEDLVLKPIEQGPTVPFSTALALRGVNVIVVDTPNKEK